MQIGIIEAIFRLTEKKERINYFSLLSCDQDLRTKFLSVQDSEFETVFISSTNNNLRYLYKLFFEIINVHVNKLIENVYFTL